MGTVYSLSSLLQKNIIDVQALINLGSEVNIITPAYVAKLGLKVWPTDIRAQKINGSLLRTFKRVIANFLALDKLDWACFF